MDVIEAINGRRSVRAFKPDPVPKDVLEAIMRAALQVPSWENTQPWEFAVVGGEAMRELKAAVMGKVRAGEKPNLDIPWPKFKGVHLERAKAEGRDVLQWVGISKGDSGARLNWQVSMTQFFHAPNAVIAYMDAYLGEWSVL
ncbi:MAG: nitroreductase family protein, partial [Chloroflexi bacterium]|nr:nitroreductase family protein [Chloroflexota bacterium]